MSPEIVVYIEGGGDQKETRAKLRRGFEAFFDETKQRALEKGIQLRILLCGGRNCAIDDFQVALLKHPDALSLLLVDSEGPVTCASPREHLRRQGCDPGQRERVADDRCHLMVQTMEAWLIADRERLAEYFGKGFHEKSLPKNPNVEQIDKQALAKSLQNAAKRTSKKGYDKTRDAPRILERIRASMVRAKARHCDRLFKTLTECIDSADRD